MDILTLILGLVDIAWDTAMHLLDIIIKYWQISLIIAGLFLISKIGQIANDDLTLQIESLEERITELEERLNKSDDVDDEFNINEELEAFYPE